MREKTIIIKKDQSISTVLLNRPSMMNSFNDELVDDLMEALLELKNDDETRVIVLTGMGKAFSAGGDLLHLVKIDNAVDAKKFIAQAGDIIQTIMTMDKPIVAMVNGVAAGAGFNIALACDIIFCSKAAKFAQSFVKVGLVPDCGGNYLLPRVVGLQKAKELMFTADLIDSEEALKLGIVNYVCEPDDLDKTTYKFAERLSTSAPAAIGAMKKLINRTYELSLETVLELEADLQALCMLTEDHKEGVAAFKEKRLPNFHGK
ncbi:MAG: enoyl-CoA hydratase/isomerase family protein [Eubacteriales bacterium]|nr:enoyl-CoA hydratase/isomerase family protein [Eubacteriales bacterium]